MNTASMVLADTSAWVEYLRRTGSMTHGEMRKLVDHAEPVATCDPIVAELLAGAGDEKRHDRLRRFLLRFDLLAVRGLDDYERSADLLRTCRAAGEQSPGLIDCLIATVAIRTGSSLLHHDRPAFDAIARHAPLEIMR
jgi:predicted nucleic acid-binding protein